MRSPLRRVATAVLALVLSLPAAALATPPQAPVKPEPPRNVPAPPLFPRHRRGLYLNGLGLETIDATPQSPPLTTDDPGVPDKGVYEINLTTQADLSRHVSTFDLLFVDANYGLLPTMLGHTVPMQLSVEVPLSASTTRGEAFNAGLGPVAVGLKVNFHNSEHHSIEMSFYPQVAFHVGGRSVELDLADAGQTLVLPLLVSRELKYFTVVVNGAVSKPLHDTDRHVTGTFGVALGLNITRKLAAMVEFHSESRFDFAHDRLLVVNGALMRAIGHLVLYANLGRSLVSDDGPAHTYVGVGVKVLINPNVKKPG